MGVTEAGASRLGTVPQFQLRGRGGSGGGQTDNPPLQRNKIGEAWKLQAPGGAIGAIYRATLLR